MNKRTTKLVLGIVVLVLCLGLIYTSLGNLGSCKSVSDVKNNFAKYQGQKIRIKGKITEINTGEPNTFTLTDGKKTIRIGFGETLSQSLELNRKVVVVAEVNGKKVEAKKVLQGCASSYGGK